MKRSWLLVLTLAILAVLIGLSILRPHTMVGSGNVIPAHAGLETDCFACHVPFRGASAEKCIACHAIADIGRRTTKGVALPVGADLPAFHQALVEKNCLACHSDHPTPALTRRAPKRFDHVLLAATMRGQCGACHVAPKDAQHRTLRLPCAQCHRTSGWKPAAFDHRRYFPTTGDHDAACITCHVANDYRRYSCYGCHEHQAARMIAEHREEGISNIDNCVRCHRDGRAEDGRGEGEREEGEGNGED